MLKKLEFLPRFWHLHHSFSQPRLRHRNIATAIETAVFTMTMAGTIVTSLWNTGATKTVNGGIMTVGNRATTPITPPGTIRLLATMRPVITGRRITARAATSLVPAYISPGAASLLR